MQQLSVSGESVSLGESDDGASAKEGNGQGRGGFWRTR